MTSETSVEPPGPHAYHFPNISHMAWRGAANRRLSHTSPRLSTNTTLLPGILDRT